MSRLVTVPGEIPALDQHLRRARLELLLAAVLWSLAGIFIKFLSLPPLTIVFYRSLFAALFFAFFVRKSIAVPRIALLVSALAYTAAISAFVSANKITTAANAIALQYTAPMFVFVIVHFLFGEKITGASWVSLVLGMFGIAVICIGSAGQPDAAGVMVALLSGLLFSIYMVTLRFLKDFNPGYSDVSQQYGLLSASVAVGWIRAVTFIEGRWDRRNDGSRSTGDPLLALLKGVGTDLRPRSVADCAYRTRIESPLGSIDRRGITVRRDIDRRNLYRRQLGFSLSPLVFESSNHLDSRAVL